MKKIILIIFVLFVVWIIAFNIKVRRDEEALRILNNTQNTTVQTISNTNTDTKIIDNKSDLGTDTTGKYTTGTKDGSVGPDGLKSGDVLIPDGSSGFAPGPCPDKAMC